MNIKNILCAATIAGLVISGTAITATQNNLAQEIIEAITVTHNQEMINFELFALHQKIVNLKAKLELEQAQKEMHWENLTTCLAERNAEKLEWYELHTINCWKDEELFRNHHSLVPEVTKDGRNKANTPVTEAHDKYTAALSQYNHFQLTLKRCNRHNDTDCLDGLAKELNEWNKNN